MAVVAALLVEARFEALEDGRAKIMFIYDPDWVGFTAHARSQASP